MKKIIMLLGLLALVLAGCSKDEDVPRQNHTLLDTDVPEYRQGATLYSFSHGKAYCRFYEKADSFALEYSYSNFKYFSTIRLSNHNNILKGYNPSAMQDEEVIELAKIWVRELRKEENRYDWCKVLSLADFEYKQNWDSDHGMLWGFKPKTIGVCDPDNNKNDYFVFLTFGEDYKIGYSFLYYKSYYYNSGGKTKGEYVRINKLFPKNDGTILKTSEFLAEFDL